MRVISTTMKSLIIAGLAAAVACTVATSSATNANVASVTPPVSAPADPAKGTQTAVFSGGCFWGVEAVFEHVKGVVDVRSGYTGGDVKNPSYEQVSGGNTGNAESVLVTFDPTKVTYVQLLGVFFSVAHDPTELNYQGPDHGTQYRSAIWYANDEQKKAALDYIDAITKAKVLDKPIVTEVSPLGKFFEAEAYHQDYLKNHPDEPYIVINDQPKLKALKEKFPNLWKE
ncbi:MAG: peptide-methionine (S)-S-oxide reductase MsrA [Acidobacteria bacterium]|nr:peptide-methionine (S)-S-oxide reductase MsrA [Acidobacteriota bacterium]